ncbi:hypothetical protein [Planococcus glaciei]|uniref:hypothetical protein n=1 Tax=Planococcus glaciei TaxID=459472 RepID=UPI00111320A8|nr:hypothetical protein [Planococcus glaciei]
MTRGKIESGNAYGHAEKKKISRNRRFCVRFYNIQAVDASGFSPELPFQKLSCGVLYFFMVPIRIFNKNDYDNFKMAPL